MFFGKNNASKNAGQQNFLIDNLTFASNPPLNSFGNSACNPPDIAKHFEMMRR
jgi:hypothetical protein